MFPDSLGDIQNAWSLVANKPANSVEQIPSWEANRSSASQETPRITWNLKVHYRIHNSPHRLPLLSQIIPFFASPSRVFQIRSDIIIPIFA
jgi:hypothetical protein